MRLLCLLFFISTFYIEGLLSIKAKMKAIPPVVKRGGSATLQCTYELEGASIYTVKWYRGKHEFYKFTPKDTPQKKVFSVPGIFVDVGYSNETQVMLKNMELSVSGNFSCEVSAESSFTTAVVYTYVDVVSLPESGPVIKTERSQYNPGDVLKANCSSPPSKPAAELSFLINNEMMSLASKRIQKTDNGLEWSEVVVTEPLSDFHFKGGRMVLKCLAQVYPVYASSSTATFSPLSDPKPERITSAQSGCDRSSFQFVILIVALLVCTVFSSDYDEYFYDDYNMNDMNVDTEKLKTLLMG